MAQIDEGKQEEHMTGFACLVLVVHAGQQSHQHPELSLPISLVPCGP